MLVEQCDIIIRVAGAFLLLLLAGALIRDARHERLTWFFLPLAICLCGFLAGNTPDLQLRLDGVPGAVAHMLSGYAAVFLWWFCLAVFDTRFVPRGKTLAVGLAWLVLASVDRGMFGPAVADKGLSWLLVTIGFGIVAHLVWHLIRDREGDLIDARRDARMMVAILLGSQLLVDLLVDVVFGLDWRPRGFAMTQNVAILAFTGWLGSLVLRANVGALTFRPAARVPVAPEMPVRNRPSTSDESKLTERLRNLIDVERVHLDPELTFGDFVERMKAPERTVRVLINHQLGHDHFRAFLSEHRVAEARRLLADPSRARDKLISIAHDSGFASLASFNRAFRAVENNTPSAYRAAALGNPPTQGSPLVASASSPATNPAF
jgi:AraC-like DNA-binding protein